MSETHYISEIPCKNGHRSPRRIKDGVCLECDSLRNTERYHRLYKESSAEYKKKKWAATSKEDRQKVYDYNMNREHANPERSALLQARRRARIKGLECSITESDISIPEKCPALGIPLFKSRKGMSPNSPSLDRIDNSKGYTPDNVVVVSTKANFIKRDSTIEELILVAEFYKNLKAAKDITKKDE